MATVPTPAPSVTARRARLYQLAFIAVEVTRWALLAVALVGTAAEVTR